MRFAGDERALFAVSLGFKDQVLELFGLARAASQSGRASVLAFSPIWQTVVDLDRSGEDPRKEEGPVAASGPSSENNRRPEDHYVVGELAWSLHGRGRPNPDTLKLANRARRWWAPFDGLPLRGSIHAGRPRGSGVMSEEQFRAGLDRALAHLKGYRITQTLVADQLAMDRSTLLDYLKRYKLDWATLTRKRTI